MLIPTLFTRSAAGPPGSPSPLLSRLAARRVLTASLLTLALHVPASAAIITLDAPSTIHVGDAFTTTLLVDVNYGESILTRYFNQAWRAPLYETTPQFTVFNNDTPDTPFILPWTVNFFLNHLSSPSALNTQIYADRGRDWSVTVSLDSAQSAQLFSTPGTYTIEAVLPLLDIYLIGSTLNTIPLRSVDQTITLTVLAPDSTSLDAASAPEPGSLALLATGLAALSAASKFARGRQLKLPRHGRK